MEAGTTYVRDFSDIGNIQQGKRIRYELVSGETTATDYGIRLTIESGGNVRTDCLEQITASRIEALALLTFLYENAVSIENWRDLTVDVLKSIHNLN